MGVLLSKTAQYAIRALVDLALQSSERATPIRTIAERTNIPYPFLAKLVVQLVQSRLVSSHKGPGGGIRLMRPASKISVIEIITAMEGVNAFEACFLGLKHCGEEDPCPMHDYWAGFKSQLQSKLVETSLADLAELERKQQAINAGSAD